MGAPLRLADLLGGLSIVSDMGYGLPVETAMRACLVGTALGRRMNFTEEEVGHVFYVSLLLHVGCIAFSHETAVAFGDDLAVNRAAIRTNLTEVRQVFTVLIP
ncbi:MAG: HD domain-containing phosphohydrolase, partial [Acidimicrobiales bacterium]